MKKKSGQVIKYGSLATEFGQLFVASIAGKVCAAEFFKNQREKKMFLQDLRKIFNNYSLQEDLIEAERLGKLIFSGGGKPVGVLLFGTEFQIKVWQALASIPFGSLVSYQDVAKLVGRPRAVRAVASAIAKNRIVFLVPCHRVIRSNGEFGNYRWGLDRKKALIKWEKELCNC